MENKNARLFKITCTTNLCFDASVIPQAWDGFVVLYDNGFFEGIPYNNDETRRKYENLIFGVYYQDKMLDITMIDKERNEEAIHVQASKTKDNEYFGDIADSNYYGENSIGSCDLTFASVGVFDFMTSELEKEICCIKNKLSNNDNYRYYQDISTNYKILLKELEQISIRRQNSKYRSLKQTN